MKGSVRAIKGRKDYWELRVSAGIDPATGRYRRKVRGFRGTKKQADAELRRMVDEVEAGKTGGTSRTLGALLDQWAASPAWAELSPTTRKRYRSIIDVHIGPALGHVQLRKLSAFDLERFYADLRTRQALSASSVRQTHAVIRRALNVAVRWEWIATNVARAAEPPSLDGTRLVVPSTAEVLELIDAARTSKNPDMASLLFVAATTGMRRGELCGLRWTDVDLVRRSVKVERAIVEDAGRLVPGPTKTHAVRNLAIDEATADVLATRRVQVATRAADLGTESHPAAYVWSNEADGSEPWKPDSVTQAFTRLRDQRGLRHVHLHSLRHWAATSAIAGGEDIRTVAGRLGHSKPVVTLNTYAGWVEARDREVADRLGGLLAPPKPLRE